MPLTFDEACAAIEPLLAGHARQTIVSDAAETTTFGSALERLRTGMRSHTWRVGDRSIGMDGVIREFDRRTREEGFHVLHDWDGKAAKVNDDIIPVDVLHYLIQQRGSELPDTTALGILLDYYFFHLLSLLSVRLWDDGDPDAHLDCLNRLLAQLQGEDGAGQRFIADAETLMLVATSHYESDERSFKILLERVRTLNRTHQARIALGHAATLGCHLRFGFEANSARDTVATREDNVADYPWLCYALATLMREYASTREGGASPLPSDRIVEAMLNGLTPDARAFVGQPPASLAECDDERRAFRDAFYSFRPDLLEAFEPYRPTERRYSPLNFYFNFAHNVLKGIVVDSLLWGETRPVALNDLFTAAETPDSISDDRLAVARTLMQYARNNPDRLRGRLMPVIVYDPGVGRQSFGVALRKLRE